VCFAYALQVGLKYGLPLLSPVDDAGCFTDEAGPRFAGLAVQGEGNSAVVEALSAAGVLLRQEAYAHKYPYDWRTKKPTIFRATSQWFASVEGFRWGRGQGGTAHQLLIVALRSQAPVCM
jgi:isoleucyl-tRNA synthetase